MDLTKIDSIRVYQAVKFENKLLTFFQTGGGKHYRGLDIEIVPSIGVSIKNDKDHVIVPFPNVGSITMVTDHKEELKEERIADMSKPAQAQKVSKPRVDPTGAKRL